MGTMHQETLTVTTTGVPLPVPNFLTKPTYPERFMIYLWGTRTERVFLSDTEDFANSLAIEPGAAFNAGSPETFSTMPRFIKTETADEDITVTYKLIPY